MERRNQGNETQESNSSFPCGGGGSSAVVDIAAEGVIAVGLIVGGESGLFASLAIERGERESGGGGEVEIGADHICAVGPGVFGIGEEALTLDIGGVEPLELNMGRQEGVIVSVESTCGECVSNIYRTVGGSLSKGTCYGSGKSSEE